MKMSKQQKFLKEYLLEVRADTYKDRGNYTNDLKGMVDCAVNELQYGIHGNNNLKLVTDWLKGLGINIEYTYYGIQKLMTQAGYKNRKLYDQSYRERLAYIIIYGQ